MELVELMTDFVLTDVCERSLSCYIVIGLQALLVQGFSLRVRAIILCPGLRGAVCVAGCLWPGLPVLSCCFLSVLDRFPHVLLFFPRLFGTLFFPVYWYIG